MDRVVEQLRLLGEQLDRQVFPQVWGGGIVRPSEPAAQSEPMGKGNKDVGERTARKSPRPASRQTAARSWEAGTRTPIVRSSSQRAYERQLKAVCTVYPGSQFWNQAEGHWLLVQSALLEDCDRKALFAIAIPREHRCQIQSWGFWSDQDDVTWIGPRHTNFPDGSICAFHVEDETWQIGDPLLTLVDLYTVWAIRHLHLKLLGRWPGSQYARWLYERLIETQPDELCGCGSLEKRYSECCQPLDVKANRVAAAMRYNAETRGARREVPMKVLEFARTKRDPPQVSGYFMEPDKGHRIRAA